ncbi:MAG: TlyA family RNA methyltransferase [Firmicutes bacterium]|nr:TlyA family RNA methyltransferase [Bacillota bacterium]
MNKTKERLDILLVRQGLFPSRERARSAIMAGLVFVAGQKIEKPGTQVTLDAEIRVLGEDIPYVSRGGLKLAKALEAFKIDLQDRVVLDIGASTGGFTDCALQHGARKVYAIDVGYGQLAWKLRQDPRVVCLERTNIRHLSPVVLDEPGDVATIDVSFISLDKVLPAVRELLAPHGQVIALIKPQFEAGREKVGKKGVVRDPAVHREVIEQVARTAQRLGFRVCGLSFSPITGPEGNIEYLLHLSLVNEGVGGADWAGLLDATVDNAHALLNRR